MSEMTTSTAALTRTALLGVRFWDAVTGHVVVDGLTVTEVVTATRAVPGPSGVFVIHDLPGIRASAFGAGDDDFWRSPPMTRRVILELRDAWERFVPLRLSAEVPHRGLFAPDCVSASPPDDGSVSVPLFSSATRTAPAGFAAVRADLWDFDADAPAAWAVLEVRAGEGPVHRGIAGADGRASVLLPYPEPATHLASPPAGLGGLSSQTWPASVAVRYTPAAPSPPSKASAAPPDLCSVLGQPGATALASASPLAPLDPQTLVFGRELVLRSAGRSVLLVT